MRKVLVIILVTACLGWAVNTVWSAGTFKVTKPNGGQKYTTGKTYTIKWAKGNAGTDVKIQLLKSGKAYKTIKAKTKNDGRHRWKIPSTVKTGSAYKIKITSASTKTLKDESDKNFTITKASTTVGSVDTPNVKTPNGGESWTTGKSYTLKWDKGNGKVKIQLLKSGTASRTIRNNTKNDGRYRWRIPSSVAAGSAYKIEITSKTDNTVSDSSNKVFTITKDSTTGDALKVIYPNGGESWIADSGKEVIKWDEGDAGTHVKIELLKSGKHNEWLTKRTKNDGRYLWKIPNSVKAGSKYKIKITSRSTASVNDESDKNFTVKASGDDSSDNETIEDEQDEEALCYSNLTECNQSGDDIIWANRFGDEVCHIAGQEVGPSGFRCSFACTADLELWKGGSFHSKLASGVTAFYELDPGVPDVPYINYTSSWTVPSNLSGSDYQIKVSVSGDSGTNSTNNFFCFN